VEGVHVLQISRYLVDAVVLEGRSYREVARSHGVSKSWVGELVRRYRQGGYEALRAGSRAPHRTPHKVPAPIENRIVELRKHLVDRGFDAGAATIQAYLRRERDQVPSISAVWRVLHRRGFITPQPHKRPRSSWNRFEASLPNECWQSDVTYWHLAEGTRVEILNFLDDYSRLILASRVFTATTTADVVTVFREASKTWGFPAAILSDNGCVYTAWHRGGTTLLERELLALGIDFKHSRPGHPQTCGKIERFHQTLKRFLDKQEPPESLNALQTLIDEFIDYYNSVRPHYARGRIPPRVAFDSRDKARPQGPRISIDAGVRVRHDRVDVAGKLTLRHAGKLHHIGVGKDHRRQRVIMLIDGLDIRIITPDGELLRRLTLDPSKDYQPTGRPPGPPKGRPLGPRKKR
jgi:transposase InsO family protein